MKYIATTSLLFLLIAAIIFIYAMPGIVAIPFVLLCLWLLFWRKQKAELGMLLFSLLVLFAGLEVMVRLFADDIFYRAHEKYALQGHYRTNIEDTVKVRFGDLIAMDPTQKKFLAEPHIQEFKTDTRGFRNEQDYAGEPYVLLGDSFTATVGNSQPDILVSQLNKIMPNNFYAMGYPAGPKDYELNALRILKDGYQPRFIWMIFEGNDLNPPHEFTGAPISLEKAEENAWKKQFKRRNLPFLTTRVLSMLGKTIKARFATATQDNLTSAVIPHTINGNHIGFYRDYMRWAAEPLLELRILGTKEVLSHTACVVFIPTKYRVYRPWIPDAISISEPAAGLMELQRYFSAENIPVIDLTPALQKAAKNHLVNNEFVYWRDDTHWNSHGIKAVLSDIIQCAQQDKTLQNKK